jgi:hypothetical protein
VDRVGIFGDVQVLLDCAPRVGEKRPVGADSTTIFIGFDNTVCTYCNEPAIADLELAMELNKALGLSAVLGTVASTAENKNHRMLSLQLRQLAVFRCVVGKLIVREDSAWNDVGSHVETSKIERASTYALPAVVNDAATER